MVVKLVNASNYFLIVGGCGFLGSNFVRYLVKKDPSVQIVVLDDLAYAANINNIPIESSCVELIEGNICNREVVECTVMFADAVVNFAAETHNDNSIAAPTPFLYSNVIGTFNLLEACRKYDVRYHHVSTDEVFGDLPLQGAERFNERSPYDPSSPYSATKAASDLLVKAWIRTYGLQATISNCTNCYGPYQYPEKFIPNVVLSVLQGRKPSLYGDGRNIRDWLYADDHSAAVWKILNEGRIGQAYAISASNEMSNIEVLKMILNAMGSQMIILNSSRIALAMTGVIPLIRPNYVMSLAGSQGIRISKKG